MLQNLEHFKASKKCLILIPTYNDWTALNKLLNEIDSIIKNEKRDFEVLILNDASTTHKFIDKKYLKKINKIRIVDLKKNSGSQIAIAAGLNFVNESYDDVDLIILDSDGEDNPKEILNLLNELEKNRSKVVVAARSKRKENVILKLLNSIRLYVTYILTGYMINFGNFSCLSSSSLKKIFSKRELNLSYSGTVQKFLEIKKIPIEKHNRYHGKSKVSFGFLIIYSLQIISIFTKKVVLRSGLLIIFTFCLKYFLVKEINIILFIFMIFFLNVIFIILNLLAKRTNFLELIDR